MVCGCCYRPTAHFEQGTGFGRLAPAKCCLLSGMVVVREENVFSKAAKHNSFARKPYLPQAPHPGLEVHCLKRFQPLGRPQETAATWWNFLCRLVSGSALQLGCAASWSTCATPRCERAVPMEQLPVWPIQPQVAAQGLQSLQHGFGERNAVFALEARNATCFLFLSYCISHYRLWSSFTARAVRTSSCRLRWRAVPRSTVRLHSERCPQLKGLPKSHSLLEPEMQLGLLPVACGRIGCFHQDVAWTTPISGPCNDETTTNTATPKRHDADDTKHEGHSSTRDKRTQRRTKGAQKGQQQLTDNGAAGARQPAHPAKKGSVKEGRPKNIGHRTKQTASGKHRTNEMLTKRSPVRRQKGKTVPQRTHQNHHRHTR